MRLSKVYRPQPETAESAERLELFCFDSPQGQAMQPGYRGKHQFEQTKTARTPAGGSAPAATPAAAGPAAPGVSAGPSPEELEALVAQAQQQGYQEGLEQGRRRLEEAADALAEGLAEVAGVRRAVLERSTRDMVRLVIAVTEQVLQREFATNPEAILPVVQRALKAAVRADSYRLQVHPDDLATVTDNRPLLLASLSSVGGLSIEPDPTVGHGGCRVTSDLGEVDASLASQLDEIRRALDEVTGGA